MMCTTSVSARGLLQGRVATGRRRRWRWSERHRTPATTVVTCCYHWHHPLLQPSSCFATMQKHSLLFSCYNQPPPCYNRLHVLLQSAPRFSTTGAVFLATTSRRPAAANFMFCYNRHRGLQQPVSSLHSRPHVFAITCVSSCRH